MGLIGAPLAYPAGYHSISPYLQFGVGFLGAASVSVAWPTANKAIYMPVLLAEPLLVTQMWVENGATASGNIDVGIYDEAGTRIVSSGSTAQSGTSAMQVFNVTDTLLGPGVFYIAVALDNTTGTVHVWGSATTILGRATGALQQTSAFALPAVATFATLTTYGTWLAGFTGAATI